MMGIGGVALVIIIAIAATYGGMSTDSPEIILLPTCFIINKTDLNHMMQRSYLN